jgi:pyruvate-ferredoxin/flavodoxin oxidoreductase
MKKMKSMDGNSATTHIAYAFSEVLALYPITPSSSMGEEADLLASIGRKNIFSGIPKIITMQSEAGAAGALHGALSAGAFCSTFTASQGLLLMIPNMYKIAGELMPCVFHVSARAIAGQALSIFGDHQDVMATRATGFCLLCSNSVQEAMDLSLVAHLSSIRASLPFIHFFDGFRTSHEIQKIEEIDYSDVKKLVDWKKIDEHRKRALNPEHPHLKGSAQNPDIYFQATEASNSFYVSAIKIVEEEMNNVFVLTGRRYKLFDYVGHPEAEKIIIMMGSGAETAEEVVNHLVQKGEKVGLVKVRLYRPFSTEHLLKAIPKSTKKIAVLDRTKESGSLAEPLYLDICAALQENGIQKLVIGGRYGLGSKEFNPPMVLSVFDNLDLPEPKKHFTVGILDDVTHTSLKVEENIDTSSKDCVSCKFWGLGGDGTVGANKQAIKIIGDNTNKFVQGYFSYDSKKSGGITVSHLRFSNDQIHSTYLISSSDYLACHNPSFIGKYDIINDIKEGGTFVLNTPWTQNDLDKKLPWSLKATIANKKVQFYIIDATAIAKKTGIGRHINMIMQTVFFKLVNIIPIEKAISFLKDSIEKNHAKKGEDVIQMNKKAVDMAIEKLEKVNYPKSWANEISCEKQMDNKRPDFIKNVADVINKQKGDSLPVSAFTPGGVYPSSTTKYEKRDIATELPEWIKENCIQCNQCSFACPHASIRPFLLTEKEVKEAPSEYEGLDPVGKPLKEYKYSIQVYPEDCTGCGICAEICPAVKGKALVMKPKKEVFEKEKKVLDYVSKLPLHIPTLNKFSVKGSQFRQPLLEFSGACSGCGETPYVKLLTQLFGERMIISNATGCSSIWGGSAPSIPWTTNEKGCGPAWANSLFEDNAEYGFGMQTAISYRRDELASIIKEAIKENIKEPLSEAFENWLKHKDEGDISQKISTEIKAILEKTEKTQTLTKIWERRDILTKPSIWIIGGDGWAYDIGYGGLDHVIAMNQDVNIMVLDTEVYSNTGGQASKATQMGAIAKFASSGKKTIKKDLGMIAISYGNVYVASVALGADKRQVITAIKEAEEYDGPSIIIGYGSCLAHGAKGGITQSHKQQQAAVDSGYWVNYRFNPALKKEGKNPFQLDSKTPTLPLIDFLSSQSRYNYLQKTNPEIAKQLNDELNVYLKEKYETYLRWSEPKKSFLR